MPGSGRDHGTLGHLSGSSKQACSYNVIVLAIPLAFIVRLLSDRELLGSLANSPARRALLWTITASLLAFGLAGIAGLAP